MPTYEFFCEGCGHAFERDLRIAEREQPLEEACSSCGEKKLNRAVGGMIVSGVNLAAKVPSGFKEVIRNIKKRNRNSRIDGELC